jgi:hypothetical protein
LLLKWISTFAPQAAKRLATAAPMPELAPKITVFLSLSPGLTARTHPSLPEPDRSSGKLVYLSRNFADALTTQQTIE